MTESARHWNVHYTVQASESVRVPMKMTIIAMSDRRARAVAVSRLRNSTNDPKIVRVSPA